MTAKEIMVDLETKMKKTVEATQREFGAIRTGRASVALVDNVRVEYYGTVTPLKQMAAISTPDARSILIHPWDKAALAEIEKAILKSDIGISPTNDGNSIRLAIPPLTTERRAELDKILKKISEDGRVSVRTARHHAMEAIKKTEKDKTMTEDERFKTQEQIQKTTDKYIKEIDNILASKEKEIQA